MIFFEFLKETVAKELHTKVQESVKNLDNEIKDTKTDISQKVRELESSIRGQISSAAHGISAAQAKLNVLDYKISALDSQINSRKKELDRLNKIKNLPKVTELGIEIAALEIAKGSLIAAREVAKGTLAAGGEIAKGTLEAGKEISKGSVKAGGEIAKAGIKTGSGLASGLGLATEFLLELPEKVFYVKDASLEAGFEDLIHGRLPHFILSYYLFDKLYNLDVQLDLSSKQKAAESAKTIAHEILKLLGR